MILLFLTLMVGNVSAMVDNNKILIISSYGTDYQWSNSIIDGINLEMKKSHPGMEIDVEYLSSERLSDPLIWVERLGLLLEYHEGDLPRAIVLISDEAWMAYRGAVSESFKDVPVFLCAVKHYSIDIHTYKEHHKNLTLDHFTPTQEVMKSYNATAVLREMNIEGYVDLMVRMIPRLDRLALITDNRFYGIYTKLLFEKYIDSCRLQLPVEYMDARFVNSDSLLAYLPTVSTTTGVLMTSWLTGEHGFTYSKNYIYSQMATMLKTPIFLTNNIGLDKGYFLGGYFNEAQFWGIKISSMLDESFAGRSPKSIIPQSYKDTLCHINWNVLNNFNLDESQVPEEVIYFNRPVSPLVEYRNKIIFGGVFVLFLIVNYVYVIGSNIKLRRTQKLNRQLIDEAEVANQNLQHARGSLVVALNKAEEADRLKSDFVASMSHEIRTPLSAIVGFSSLIASMESLEERRDVATHIRKSSDSLLNLVESILDLSQLESGKVSLSQEDSSAYALCVDLLNAHRSLCSDNVTLNFMPFAQDMNMVTDPHRLSQVIKIMLSNAIMYTQSGSIELGYFPCNDRWVEFYVKDTGVGIPEEEREQIFERFVKLNAYDSGAGLGLTVAKYIIDLFGGEIGVTSEVGVGSRFWFRIKRDINKS